MTDASARGCRAIRFSRRPSYLAGTDILQLPIASVKQSDNAGLTLAPSDLGSGTVVNKASQNYGQANEGSSKSGSRREE